MNMIADRFTARLALTLLIAAAAVSCGRSESPIISAPPSSAPHAPSANVPVPTGIVSLDNGVDLAQVRNQQMIHPLFSLTPPDVDAPVVMAAVQDDDKDTGAAVVLKKLHGQWKIVEFAEAGHAEWVYAAAITPRKELWGVLDAAGETRAPQLTLVRSTDNGVSWRYFAAVKKPAADAEYAGFAMAADGQGRLSMHIDDDDAGVSHGYYHYKTLDGGKSWTGPTFEGDDVTEADSLKDFDTIQDAIKDLESPPAQ